MQIFKQLTIINNFLILFVLNPTNLLQQAHAKNVALGAEVKASSSYNECTADNVVDGKLNGNVNRWLNNPTDEQPWIRISFENLVKVQAVRICFDANGGERWVNASYRIESVCHDGSAPQVLATVERNSSAKRLTTFDPVTAEAIQIVFTKNADDLNINRILQIEVFDINEDMDKIVSEGLEFPLSIHTDYNWNIPGIEKSQRAQNIIEVDDRVQLFVDDFLISDAENLLREMNPAEKHPKCLLDAEKPWENGRVVFPNVLRIDGEFRMWYLAWGLVPPHRNGDKVDGQLVPVSDTSFLCYANSNDGIHWIKPELEIHEFRGSKKNNILLRHEGSHFDSFSIIYRPEIERPFQMMIWQGTWPYKKELIEAKGYNFEIDRPGHYAFDSKDGIHWEYMHKNPPKGWQDRSNISYDHERKVYMGFVKSGYNGVRSRSYSESEDLITWGSPKWALIPEWLQDSESKVDPKPIHHYGMLVFNYKAQYLGYLESMYQDHGKRKYLQLLASHNPGTWTRVAAPNRFIDMGEYPSWDSGKIDMPGTAPIEYDGKLWIFYSGTLYNTKGNHSSTTSQVIGLATIPKDRFAALRPDDSQQDGILTTVPLKLRGKHIFVNADARMGMLKVELLDKNRNVLAGFSRDDCIGLIMKDELDTPIEWKSGRSLPKEPVRMRYILSDAKLYAFRTGDDIQ